MADEIEGLEAAGGVDGILQILSHILLPALGEERTEQVLAWTANEAKTRPIVAYCYDRAGQCWQLGSDSPISEGRKVFAMMHWEAQRCCVAYCYKELEIGGKKATQFYRELIMDPQHVTGPVSHHALFQDLREQLVDDASAVLEDYLAHLRGKLDPKTIARVVEASRGFLAFDFQEENEDDPQPTNGAGAGGH
jgi:hypothetical protein